MRRLGESLGIVCLSHVLHAIRWMRTRETHFNEVSRDSLYTVYVHYTYNMYTYGVCKEVAQAEDAAPRDVYENGYVCM